METKIREDFLHYVWQFQKFNCLDILTTGGEPVIIIKPGYYNTAAGPDFSDARLKIDGTLWAGNVEIHVESSDWFKHNHQDDQAYDSVILHVVLVADVDVFRKDGSIIPTLELRGLLSKGILKRYNKLFRNPKTLLCASKLHTIGPILLRNWLDRLMAERLESKTENFNLLLDELKGDWDEAFFRILAGGFGLRHNKLPFEQLAGQLTGKRLQRHLENSHQIEALLFGQAGFLETDFDDQYPRSLQIEFKFLKKKYGIIPMDRSQWKFLRMRPAGFPSLRIAQFAVFVMKYPRLLDVIKDQENLSLICQMLNVQAPSYWNTRYIFDRDSPFKAKFLGEDAIFRIMINCIIPFLFYYGSVREDRSLKDKTLNWLQLIKAEDNKILRSWKSYGIAAESAGHSQALIHLKQRYCDKKRCLRCAIGHRLMGEWE